MEALLEAISDNFQLRIFGCALFGRVHKERQRDKFECRAHRRIYLGNDHGLHLVYLSDSRRDVTIKHVLSMNVNILLKKTKGNPAVTVQHEYPANENNGI